MGIVDLTFENTYGRQAGKIIAGVDEVGRGPLAGPVITCALILPDDLTLLPAGIMDSKQVSARKRAHQAPLLMEHCTYAFGEASVEEIDMLNIFQATMLAMTRAVRGLALSVDLALIDGPHIPKELACAAMPIVDGDARCLSIAAASILAKEKRDALMRQLACEHPHYGWEKNAGYGTLLHREALQKFGVTPHHRRSFAPVRNALMQQQDQNA